MPRVARDAEQDRLHINRKTTPPDFHLGGLLRRSDGYIGRLGRS
jgi:hypothetical protein